MDGSPSEADLRLAAQIAGRFSQGREADEIEAEITPKGGTAYRLTLTPMRQDEFSEAWYL